MNTGIVEFLRKKDFVLERELGAGACGRTVLLFDNIINERFACKKYAPLHDQFRDELFNAFVQEIKILHKLGHENVVRLFNYYLYPERKDGFILMEFVQGSTIEEYIAVNPEKLNDVFDQVVKGFVYLEENGVLHRDIRVANILVTEWGTVKIIDFGFGKVTVSPSDFAKSISLNWWCEPPDEFNRAVYDFGTEVYFVGRLFEKLISDLSLENFKYGVLLRKMCIVNAASRIESFSHVRKAMLSSDIAEIDFDDFELDVYRTFASQLASTVTQINSAATYNSSPDSVIRELDDCFKKVMLEELVQNASKVISCFVKGAYRYQPKSKMYVDDLRDFIKLLRVASQEKQNVIIANIQTRLDAKERFYIDDDIPF